MYVILLQCNKMIKDNESILCEGVQATLLDIAFGSYTL